VARLSERRYAMTPQVNRRSIKETRSEWMWSISYFFTQYLGY